MSLDMIWNLPPGPGMADWVFFQSELFWRQKTFPVGHPGPYLLSTMFPQEGHENYCIPRGPRASGCQV